MTPARQSIGHDKRELTARRHAALSDSMCESLTQPGLTVAQTVVKFRRGAGGVPQLHCFPKGIHQSIGSQIPHQCVGVHMLSLPSQRTVSIQESRANRACAALARDDLVLRKGRSHSGPQLESWLRGCLVNTGRRLVGVARHRRYPRTVQCILCNPASATRGVRGSAGTTHHPFSAIPDSWSPLQHE